MDEREHLYGDPSSTRSGSVPAWDEPAPQACRGVHEATGQRSESRRTLAHEALSGEGGRGLVIPPRSSLYRKERVKIIKGVIRDE